MTEREFNGQGKYLWSLVKAAGWDKPAKKIEAEAPVPTRFEQYLLKTFKATHINALSQEEMRQAINTMKAYAAKEQKRKAPLLRQSIMALCVRNGWDKEQLHAAMESWKYPPSLRALDFPRLLEVRGLVMQALGVKTVKGVC